MRKTRFLLLSLVLTLALGSALLRPLSSRASGEQHPRPRRAAPASARRPHLLLRHELSGFVRAAEAQRRKLAAAKRTHRAHRARRAHRVLALGVRAVQYAERLLGTPYRYGGTSPQTGFDCSGFVRYVYEHLGISLAHSSYADLGRGFSVSRSQLRPGDLVFFDGGGHVGIYVGHDEFIHAPHTGTVVRISTLSGWYSSRYDGARRLN